MTATKKELEQLLDRIYAVNVFDVDDVFDYIVRTIVGAKAPTVFFVLSKFSQSTGISMSVVERMFATSVMQEQPLPDPEGFRVMS